MFKVIITEGVYVELNEAALYYESKQFDLGLKFVIDWQDAMNQLKVSPLLFQKKYKQFRSIQLKHFPYVLIYEIEDAEIYVYRLTHSRRNPKKVFKKK